MVTENFQFVHRLHVGTDLLTHVAMIEFFALLAVQLFFDAGEALLTHLVMDLDPIQAPGVSSSAARGVSVVALSAGQGAGELFHFLIAGRVVADHLLGELLHFLRLRFALSHFRDFDFIFRTAANYRGDLLIGHAVLTLLSGELTALLALLTLLKLILLAGLKLIWLSGLLLSGLLLARLLLTRLKLLAGLGTRRGVVWLRVVRLLS